MGEVFEAEGGSNDLPQQKKADINEVLNTLTHPLNAPQFFLFLPARSETRRKAAGC